MIVSWFWVLGLKLMKLTCAGFRFIKFIGFIKASTREKGERFSEGGRNILSSLNFLINSPYKTDKLC